MDRSRQLGEASINSLLWKFSMPAIIGMMTNALYNVVDRIFVGRGVGSLGIAGVTVGFPLMLVLMSFSMLVGLGATTLISIRLGQQKKEEAELFAGQGMVLLITVMASLGALGLIFLDPILKLSGASPEVMPYARDFVGIILCGSVFQGIGFGMNNFIRADGSPKVAMLTQLIGAILNAILCGLFIFGFGWGIKGSALATVTAQGVSSLWVLWYFFGGKSMIKIRRPNLKLHWPAVKLILAIGSAPFVMQLAASVLQVIMNTSLVAYGGDVALSAMGIVNSVALLMLMPIFGINQGSQPIIGYNYGARHYQRVKDTLKTAALAATVVVCVGFVIIQVFPAGIIGLFNDEPELVQLGTRALRIFLLALPVIGFQAVGANYFQAVGKPKQAMVLSLSRQVLILIPLLLILPRYFGLTGILFAGPLSDLGSALVTAFWLWRELGHLGRKADEQLA